MIRSPVLFIIFNRPETTFRVFEKIRNAQPTQLFIAADGPRPGNAKDEALCCQSRSILKLIDWDCEVTTLFREKNIGCRYSVSSAIDWFFENVEEGIILEDDCLPSESFFKYCHELLDYYRLDTRVMQVCGLNVLKKWNRSPYSYFFSNYGPVWGWASWRRAWKFYDVQMKLWPEIREKKLYEDFSQNIEEAEFRLALYDKVYSGEIDTWDYQWGFAKMVNNGLSVISSSNQISNLGFNDSATHTVSGCNSPYASMQTFELKLPLIHPDYIVRDCQADMRYLNEFMSVKSAKISLKQSLFNLLPKHG